MLCDDRKQWNASLIREIFSPDEAEEILKVNISESSKPNERIWYPSTSRNYTIKSAHLWSQKNMMINNLRILRKVWKQVWNSNLHNRHKHLIWKSILNILPTKDRISEVINVEDRMCLLCE